MSMSAVEEFQTGEILYTFKRLSDESRILMSVLEESFSPLQMTLVRLKQEWKSPHQLLRVEMFN